MITKLLWLATCLLLCSIAAAQTSRQSPRALPKGSQDPWSQSEESSLPEDMRRRMAMERAESEHRKVLEDVDELNALSAEVKKTYHERGRLSDDELKQLSKIEKLAKRVLSHALGDQVEDKSVEPSTIAEAVDQMSAAAASISKTMKAETRFVVSAAVIASSNEVIRLAHFIRRAHTKTD